MAAEKVIVYGYDTSPMYMKVRYVLLMKRIPHSVVYVEDKPPRPQLLEFGITYRRIPVASIGNDVYFDTRLIIDELERRFTPEQGFPSVYTANGPVEKLLMTHYADNNIFPIAASFIPASRLSAEFKKDRQQFNPTMDFEALNNDKPRFLSQLRTHMYIMQSIIAKSSTPWLLSTPEPTIVDIALFNLVNWAIRLRATSVLILPASKAPAEYRQVMEWVEAMRARTAVEIEDASNPAGKPPKMDKDTAAHYALNASPTGSLMGKKLFVDPAEPLIQAGWVSEGDAVSVTPTDSGRVPQFGTLVGLTAETVSIRIQMAGSQQSVVGHFPRLGYKIQREKASAKL
ncbi:hypothetical protein DL93DRAFT_2170239 [Clavulina sp. PMI_390]|nr:hypothetical protein DL93DRAFT_2170239 [Clavulina sp. PMI_390]